MFQRTAICRLSGYALFVKQNFASTKGATVPQKIKTIAKAYKQLSASKKKALSAQGAKIKPNPAKARNVRGLHSYVFRQMAQKGALKSCKSIGAKIKAVSKAVAKMGTKQRQALAPAVRAFNARREQRPRKANVYARFVKAEFKKNPKTTFKAVAKAWKQQAKK